MPSSSYPPKNGIITLKLRFFAMVDKNTDPALILLTLSDLHGHLEPTYTWGQDKNLHQVGGISRIAEHINNIKKQYPDKVLLFGSGDYFFEDFNRGTYFLAFGAEIFVSFLNILSIDASTIGNHEFDFGLDLADKGLNACSFPIIATNLQHSDLSCKIAKKLVIHKHGYKIGILGIMAHGPLFTQVYAFMHTIGDAGHPPLVFEPDLYNCVQKAVNELTHIDKVDFVVVLSHIGIEEDKKLAEQVDGIDIICGGHTHAATKKGCEMVVQKSSGTATVISHPGDNGRTLGMIKLWPKENGRLIFECDLLDMNDSVAQEQQIEEKFQSCKRQLPSAKVLITSTCPIDTTKEAVRKQENSFANFVTDVIRDHFDVDIVLINASGIRGEEILAPGPITTRDLDNLFPFDNDLLIRLKVKGKQIREALEFGVSDITGDSRNLLHASGLRYTVDPLKPALVPDVDNHGMVVGSKQQGSRIVHVDVQSHDNQLYPLADNHEYDIIINSMMVDKAFYVAQFYMFKPIKDQHSTGLTAKQILTNYCAQHATMCPIIDGRLKSGM
jgi:5'-nucleotidase / UDP-sugar diphosphatase